MAFAQYGAGAVDTASDFTVRELREIRGPRLDVSFKLEVGRLHRTDLYARVDGDGLIFCLAVAHLDHPDVRAFARS